MKRINLEIVSFGVQVLGIITFVASKLNLPTPPSEVPVSTIGFLGIILFFIGLSGQIYFLIKKNKLRKPINTFIAIVLFSFAFVFSLFSTHPVFKQIMDAKTETEKSVSAVLQSNELGNKVKTNQITKEEASNQISSTYSNGPEVRNLAQQSLEKTVNTNKTVEEIKTEVYPTIPLNPNYWTCSEIGCSFTDSTKVWTISNTNRTIGMIISLTSLLAIMLIVNDEKIKVFR